MKDEPINAQTFGAVLINSKREFLLRQPTGHFGGYSWTFPKGYSSRGELPSETALRHVEADTGWKAEILADIPGTFTGSTSASKFFLAGRLGRQGDHDAQTAAVRWADYEEAIVLIRESANEVGRDRDLSILGAAQEVVQNLSWVDRPAACEEDWPDLQQLPSERAEIEFELCFDEAAMSRIRKGFRPKDMDEKWFIWFRDEVLHLHRSWTGICIYEVPFHRADDLWWARSATVNRDPEQYGETRDEEDQRLLGEVIEMHLLDDDYQHPEPFGGALSLALQANYLGSPGVISGILDNVILAAERHYEGQTNFNAVWDTIWTISNEIATGDEYTRMPGWHTPSGLGASLLKNFRVIRELLFEDDLVYPVSEALMAIYLKVRDCLTCYYVDENAGWESDAAPLIKALREWATTVFLGTNEVLHPNVTLDDFSWQFTEAT